MRKDQAFGATLLEGLASPFTAPGQLRFEAFADTGITVVQGHVDGDTEPEFEIHLVGVVALTAADFVL